MRIALITPRGSDGRNGNGVTALRYSRILQGLGHRVTTGTTLRDSSSDLLIALHAGKSSDSIRRFTEKYPDGPAIVVLTGTDLYRDIKMDAQVKQSLELASRIVVLQPRALEELPVHLRRKTSVIYQSATCITGRKPNPPASYFKVCVVGNLRPEKDPLRAALASRGLPSSSRIRVVHAGAALSEEFRRRAQRESANNPRYRWIGPLPHWKARRLIASSHLVAITSRIEGSSNVLSEALVFQTPVVASRVPGLIGTLGEEFPGYFSLGNTRELANLLEKLEGQKDFYEALRADCERLAPLAMEEREIESWREVLEAF
jgi:putative glycosyltransferase (TIGR04348 family)